VLPTCGPQARQERPRRVAFDHAQLGVAEDAAVAQALDVIEAVRYEVITRFDPSATGRERTSRWQRRAVLAVRPRVEKSASRRGCELAVAAKRCHL